MLQISSLFKKKKKKKRDVIGRERGQNSMILLVRVSTVVTEIY